MAPRRLASVASSTSTGRAAIAPALPPPPDHARAGARAARRRRPAGAPRRGPRTTPGSGPPRARRRSRASVLAAAELARQVLGVLPAGAVERLPDRAPQRDRGEPGRQPVHGHDPPDVEQLVVVALGLEVGVVERPLPAEVLELARDDDALAGVQPALDVPPPEPGRLDRPRLVLEHRDRALDPPPERRLDADVGDAHARRHDLAVLDPVAGRRACASRAGRRTGAAGGTAGRARWRRRSACPTRPSVGPPGSAGLGERRLEQRGAGRRAAAFAGVLLARLQPEVPDRRSPTPPTRPRSGSGSAAGRRGAPRPPRPCRARGSGAPAPPCPPRSPPSP